MRFFCTVICVLIALATQAQGHSFPFGAVTLPDLWQTKYDKDSSAVAVVLKEFGESYIDYEGTGSLIFEHHYIIKILKQPGVEQANISIPLYKSSDRSDHLYELKASSYNLENGAIKESTLSSKNVFTENLSKYYDQKKFSIPNVRVGSVIEVQYKVDRPYYFYNFQTWLFQSDIPKVSSEYWATIPAHLTYNVTWKGFLKFKKSEGEVFKDCYLFSGSVKSDCARYKFLIENVPAFVREDYMTAESNFIASINFELSERRLPTGGVDKISKEWKDVDSEILREHSFGSQLKKGKEISQKILPGLAGITDSLERAKKVYEFIRTWYTWDEYYGMYSTDGIKKAFDRKTGNIGDINLSLIASLRSAGLEADPLVLSTRENGLPTELHPVLTDFNYVVAKLNIGNKVYLLDASEPLLPFGLLPRRCMNGKGRVFVEKKPSYWYDLKSPQKSKVISVLNLTLQPQGQFTGTIDISHDGHRAYDKRKQILSYGDQKEYSNQLEKQWSGVTITKHEISGLENTDSKIVEKLEVTIEGYDNLNTENLLLNPFFIGKIKENPFRSTERLYPVDFGVEDDYKVVLTLNYPADFELIAKPERNALTLTGGTAKFLFDITDLDNRLIMNYSLAINKPIFSSNEYQGLKELYSRIIQTQQSELIFMKKK